jgi:hypothetical protein
VAHLGQYASPPTILNRIPDQHIDDGAGVALCNPPGPEARLALQALVDIGVGCDDCLAVLPVELNVVISIASVILCLLLRHGDHPCPIGRTISSFTSTFSGWLIAKPIASAMRWA